MGEKIDLAVGALIDQAAQGKVTPVQLDGFNPMMQRHASMNLESLEKFAKAPYRAKGLLEFATATAFTQYLADFKTKDTTRVFADPSDNSIDAFFDFDVPNGAPGWKENRATLNMPLNPDYEFWKGHNGSWAGQNDFARTMIDYASMVKGVIQTAGGDVADLSQADFLEMLRDLNALDSSTIQAKVGNTGDDTTKRRIRQITTSNGALPEFLEAVMPIFKNGAPVTHRFRIEARVDDGDIELRYVLVRPENVREQAFNAVCKDIATVAGVTIYGVDVTA